jgi:glycosyltransferase involved in cell wall biosynthesis
MHEQARCSFNSTRPKGERGIVANKKVLILCPHPSRKGGVSDYNRLVKTYFSSAEISLSFYYIGLDGRNGSMLLKFATIVRDMVMVPLRAFGCNLVVFNPSLDAKAVLRDGFYHFIVKRVLRKSTLVFFHGWNLDFEKQIERSWKGLFNFVFNYDKALVLAEPFRSALVRWGALPGRINLETTMYEQFVVGGSNDRFNLIFMSRIVQGKGCLETILTIEILAKEFPGIKLYMAGEGELTAVLKEYVNNHKLGGNIQFAGWVEGNAKNQLLSKCGIMIFPTYSEGMPISLLEAMGMGLALVTRPVGGIPNIMVDGENGFLIGSLEPADFAEKIKYLFLNKDVWEAMSIRNKLKAENSFEVRNVVKRLEQIFLETMQ